MGKFFQKRFSKLWIEKDNKGVIDFWKWFELPLF